MRDLTRPKIRLNMFKQWTCYYNNWQQVDFKVPTRRRFHTTTSQPFLMWASPGKIKATHKKIETETYFQDGTSMTSPPYFPGQLFFAASGSACSTACYPWSTGCTRPPAARPGPSVGQPALVPKIWRNLVPPLPAFQNPLQYLHMPPVVTPFSFTNSNENTLGKIRPHSAFAEVLLDVVLARHGGDVVGRQRVIRLLKASCQILFFSPEVIITTYLYLVRNRGMGLGLYSWYQFLDPSPIPYVSHTMSLDQTFPVLSECRRVDGHPSERSSAPSCLIHIFLHICIGYWMEHHGFSLFNMDFNYEFSFTKIMGSLPANYWETGMGPTCNWWNSHQYLGSG